MEFCVYSYKITRDSFQWQDWWPLIIVSSPQHETTLGGVIGC